MAEAQTYAPADVEQAREQFPKNASGPSHAHAAPGMSGLETSGVVVSAHIGDENKTLKFPPEKYPNVKNYRDRRVLESAFALSEKNGQSITEERKQVLADLVASFDNPKDGKPTDSYLGQTQKFLDRKAASIARAGGPEAQAEKARSELAGWLGERINIMFGLSGDQVKTVFGQSVLEKLSYEATKLVETSQLLQSKAFLARLSLSLEEAVDGERVFRPEVKARVNPKDLLGSAVVFDPGEGGYVANPEIVFPKAPAVKRVLRTLNEALDKPDALVVPVVREKVRDDLSFGRSSEVPVGVCETKAYLPWEVERMANLTAQNPNRNEFGGVDEEGHNLIIGLARQLNYVSELSPVGFNREAAVFVLRFPADAPEEALKGLGRLAVERGNRNIVIQTLPYTRAELDDLIEATLAKVNLAEIVAQASERKK